MTDFNKLKLLSVILKLIMFYGCTHLQPYYPVIHMIETHKITSGMVVQEKVVTETKTKSTFQFWSNDVVFNTGDCAIDCKCF